MLLSFVYSAGVKVTWAQRARSFKDTCPMLSPPYAFISIVYKVYDITTFGGNTCIFSLRLWTILNKKTIKR